MTQPAPVNVAMLLKPSEISGVQAAYWSASV
jgi:hypothetical protein